MILFEQRRDFGEKINTTFSFLTENIRGLGLALLYIVGPVALVGGIISGYAQAGVLGSASSIKTPDQIIEFYGRIFSGGALVGFAFQLIGYVLVSLVTYSYIHLYRRNPGRPIEVSEVWAEVQGFIGSGIMLTIASSIMMAVAFVLFVLPGVYVMVTLSLATPVLVFERADVGQAISRSFKLISNNWWATAGLLLVMGIVAGIIGIVFTIPAGIVGGLFGAGVLKEATLLTTVATAFGSVGTSLLQSLSATAAAVQYFNLVEEKEGSSLDHAIDRIGQPTNSSADELPASVRRAAEEEGEY